MPPGRRAGRCDGAKGAGKSPGDLITATEIACWVYCQEQWRLQYGLGLEPSNRKERAAGERCVSRFPVLGHLMSGGLADVNDGQAFKVPGLDLA
jgi:hypothetical protein